MAYRNKTAYLTVIYFKKKRENMRRKLVFVHIDCHKCGQASCPYFMWVFSALIGAATYALDPLILGWSSFLTILLCVVISSLCYAKIFFTLRQRQFQVQDGAFQAKRNQTIPLNIARYRKAVYNSLWVQVTLLVCYLP